MQTGVAVIVEQSTGVMVVHVPVPLQLPPVKTVPLHELQLVPLPGPTQAPVAPSHDVAPQTPVVVHAAVQQLPVPLVPHTPLVH